MSDDIHAAAAQYVRDYARLLDLSETEALAEIARMMTEPAEPFSRRVVTRPSAEVLIDWADDGVVVFSDDPGHAHGGDGTIYDVRRDGGDHCSVTDNTQWIGCSLPVGHDGRHLPTDRELLRYGVRLSPSASPLPDKQETTTDA